MKIIDLLNKIANGENIPYKIKYGRYIFYYENGNYRNADDLYFFAEYKLNCNVLNDEVEILDEPKENKIEHKIEELKTLNSDDTTMLSSLETVLDFRTLKNKINELIDEVNQSKENK